MSSKKLVSAFVLVLSLALSLPAFAAQPNRSRDRETKGPRFGESVIVRIIQAVRRGVASNSDGLTVPKP